MKTLCSLQKAQPAYYLYTGQADAVSAVKTSYLPGMQIEIHCETRPNSGVYNTLVARGNSDYGTDNAWCLFDEKINVRYQFKFYSANSEVKGSFLLESLPPIVPNSHEPADYVDMFNRDPYLDMNNCYTYALCMWANAHPRSRGLDPGELSRQPALTQYLQDYFFDHTITAAEVIAAIEQAAAADLLTAEGAAGIFRAAARDEILPTNCYKVALVISRDDYHWYRQVKNSLWIHKPGITKARYIDDFLEYIIDPETCNHRNYPYFGGYFAVSKPVNRIPGNLIMEDKPKEKISRRMDLTEDDLKAIIVGMDINTVRRTLGDAHDWEGNGLIKDIYYTVDGAKYTISYLENMVQAVFKGISFLKA